MIIPSPKPDSAAANTSGVATDNATKAGSFRPIVYVSAIATGMLTALMMTNGISTKKPRYAGSKNRGESKGAIVFNRAAVPGARKQA